MVTTETCAPTSAAAAANEFLVLGWAERGVPPIDQMKLQKLLFYAHAWHLALKEVPLFEEDFEAWPWGPVIRDVYFQTRQFGRAPISKHITKLELEGGNLLDARFTQPTIQSETLKSFIREVWETHKDLSGIQLSNSTHAPGEPWSIIKESYKSLDSKPTIPNDLIKTIFKAKLVNDTSENTSS